MGIAYKLKKYAISNFTTPDVTLGEACRASCSFPIAYERCKLNIGGKKMSFYDGGMVMNPIIPVPGTQNINVLATFRKSKANTMSRYKSAWMIPEEQADFVIKPYLGKMGSFGTPDDIQMATDLGYLETVKKLPELLELLK